MADEVPALGWVGTSHQGMSACRWQAAMRGAHVRGQGFAFPECSTLLIYLFAISFLELFVV